jgi:DNA-binding NtrC family response regulator
MSLNKPLLGTRIFVVDDEDALAWSIETEMKAAGAEVMRAASLREALAYFPNFHADVAICDLKLPDGNGLELLKKWREDYPSLPVILITAHGAIDSAVTALRLGAFDYLQKPFDLKDLGVAIRRASEVSLLRQKLSRMQGVEKGRDPLRIIGSSPCLEKHRNILKKLANSKADTVLILGESGSGKELAARAIHEWSKQFDEPYVEINCASIPETLLESELFGHERGAFTDARERKTGLFEMAGNGTIFLDEIGELPAKLQAKLLRVLEYRRFRRLGGTKEIVLNARVVAATNRNLRKDVAEGHFRADLYYRLNVLPISIPPLRDRKGDIPDLVDFFVDLLCKQLEIEKPSISQDAYVALKHHQWPGNIRELKNVLQKVLVFYEPKIIQKEHLDLEADFDISQDSGEEHNTGNYHGPITTALLPNGEIHPFPLPDDGVSLDKIEKSLLVQALERARFNQTRAAQLLDISRHTLRYRLEKHGLLQNEPHPH